MLFALELCAASSKRCSSGTSGTLVVLVDSNKYRDTLCGGWDSREFSISRIPDDLSLFKFKLASQFRCTYL